MVCGVVMIIDDIIVLVMNVGRVVDVNVFVEYVGYINSYMLGIMFICDGCVVLLVFVDVFENLNCIIV